MSNNRRFQGNWSAGNGDYEDNHSIYAMVGAYLQRRMGIGFVLEDSRGNWVFGNGDSLRESQYLCDGRGIFTTENWGLTIIQKA
jgi:hypothetical protein